MSGFPTCFLVKPSVCLMYRLVSQLLKMLMQLGYDADGDTNQMECDHLQEYPNSFPTIENDHNFTMAGACDQLLMSTHGKHRHVLPGSGSRLLPILSGQPMATSGTLSYNPQGWKPSTSHPFFDCLVLTQTHTSHMYPGGCAKVPRPPKRCFLSGFGENLVSDASSLSEANSFPQNTAPLVSWFCLVVDWSSQHLKVIRGYMANRLLLVGY